jgi:hypothetical protein
MATSVYLVLTIEPLSSQQVGTGVLHQCLSRSRARVPKVDSVSLGQGVGR